MPQRGTNDAKYETHLCYLCLFVATLRLYRVRMALSQEVEAKLERFVNESSFASSGVVVTDLDGTAVHEFQGRITIPKEVELGLMRHYEHGRPLILNSLRFPLSVIRTFGQDWYKLSNAPIPTKRASR